ncbi:MAG: integration host factor subunit alpha [Pseudomonadota bacterium]|nr:integration host factor subunit alpha [Gammaproteobacteria bacterium]MBU1927050.1 integration host factor subunit alpha [Gammaproteobacteria bacterium]MBU2545863.1 integration host factor subunit alpha [Gammaproteobacteria bacterium]
MAALTKSDLTEQINRDIGLNKREAKEVVEQFFEEIKASLAEGWQVKLPGLGNFVLRNKTLRPGRNPITGEFIPVNARRVVTFKASLKLKQQVSRLRLSKQEEE